MTWIFFFCFNLDDHHLTGYEIKKIKTVGFLNSFELKLISAAHKAVIGIPHKDGKPQVSAVCRLLCQNVFRQEQ